MWAHMRPLCDAARASPRPLDGYRSINAPMESIISLFKTECIRTTIFHRALPQPRRRRVRTRRLGRLVEQTPAHRWR